MRRSRRSAGPAERAGRRAARPGLEYVVRTMRALNPGAEVTLRRAPGRSGGSRWALLPRPQAPHLVVPSAPRAAATGALDGLGTGRARALVARCAQAGVSMGALALLPGLVVRGGGPGVEALLADVLGQPVRVALVVGRERALQKPVLRVLDRTGRTLAYAKVGTSATTRALVDHEAATLTHLAAADLQALRVPVVLAHEEWNGLSVLVQEALSGTTPPSAEMLADAARELARVDGVSTGPLAASPLLRSLSQRVRDLPDSAVAAVIASSTDDLVAAAGTFPVAWGSWHGDFAPWNISSDGDRVLVWDWEGYDGPAPAGADLLHHDFQRSVVLEDLAPGAAVRRLSATAGTLLRPWGSADPQLDVLLYLLQLATGLLESGDHKTRISRLEEWFEPAVRHQATLVRVGR